MEAYPATDLSPRQPGRAIPRPAWGGTCWVLFIVLVTSTSGSAVESDEGIFRLDVYTTYEWDAGSTKNWVWTVSTNQFWIAPIPQWSLKVNRAERRLEVYNAGRTSLITLRFSSLTNAPSQEQLRQIVSERYKLFKVTDERMVNSGCGSAAVFDLLFIKDEETVQPSTLACMAAMIVAEGGVIEATLHTSARSLQAVRSQPELVQTFNRFLVGLRLPSPDKGTAVP